MSLVTQIASLATRVATEIKLLRTQFEPALPTVASGPEHVLTDSGAGPVWKTHPSLASVTTSGDIMVSGMTVGLGAGAEASNVAFGTDALAANTTGYNSVAMGAEALLEQTSGGYNVAVGYAAWWSLSGSATYNTAIGTLAASSWTSGGSNTIIGAAAGDFIASGSSNTLIGRWKGPSSGATLSSTLVLSAGTTVRAYCDSAGKWGFGTTAPTAGVDTAGDAIRVRTAATPASASAAGDTGTVKWDTNYVYVCVATNTWKRAALSTW